MESEPSEKIKIGGNVSRANVIAGNGNVINIYGHLPLKGYHLFVGRANDLGRIMDALRNPQHKPAIAIVGMGGIGKTTLASEAIERIKQENLFEYIVWTSAKAERFVGEGVVKTGISDFGFDQLLIAIGSQCGQDDIAKMPLEQRKTAIKSLLAEKRILVVIDNLDTILESEKLVDDILQILGGSRLLITSRHDIKNDQVFKIILYGFPEEEGILFLREESKERGIEVVANAETRHLAEIYRVTGGAPLAMKLVIGQMSRLSMDTVLKKLKEAKFSDQDYDFYRFIFKHSWDMLDLTARKVLVSMSSFPPGIGGKENALRTVSAVEDQEFSQALDQLTIMSLIDSLGDIARRRYAIHQLTYYFILSDIVKKWGVEQ